MPEPANSAPSGKREDVSARHTEPTITTCADGDRVIVTVRGELDLGTDQRLRRALRSALSRSVRGIDLDMGGVEFCDCSALNVLLSIRQQALAQSKTVRIEAAGPVVERVLTLTDTRPLFTAADLDDAADTDDAAKGDPGPGPAEEDLRIEVVQLRRAMQTRPTIDLARGILMAAFGLDPDDAMTALVTASQNTNTKLHHLAQDLVDATNGAPLPETVQKELSTAVAKVSASPVSDEDG
ncbi:anti-sigma factor antagonist [Streptomyces sp. HUCO-GS316]|uniref:anti-sigma factor antagonist n=1 Tax=Streptomyces sp. HUCO-GS316 TaxID=2692198 RepID=UPI001369D1D1|nr:anti-sigma factor antagonist [Streptomyces sp. HUCO-GS316]MXM67718.1 anti-sigma factor antagonist [Streptomyces sp. HUCO-GS316]